MHSRDLEPHELQYADRDILAERLAVLQQERADRDREVLDLIGERDHNEDMADRLASMLAEITGRDIGEHSSENNPWRNALDFGENFLIRQRNAGVKPGEVTR